MSHSKEPWSLYCEPGERPGIDDCEGSSVVWFSTSDMEGIEHEEDARRIVACVNACAGITTADLEYNPPLDSLLADAAKIKRERDEAVEALRRCLPFVEDDEKARGTVWDAGDFARAVLAKIGGQG